MEAVVISPDFNNSKLKKSVFAVLLDVNLGSIKGDGISVSINAWNGNELSIGGWSWDGTT